MIRVDGLGVSLGGNDILKDISFSVRKGEYVSIVGENGSGKSTLIKALLGQVPVKSGSIEMNVDRREVGYLPQLVSVGNFPASCYEVVLSGSLNKLGVRPFFGKREKSKALEVMELLGISHLKNSNFSHLSGGERQRTLLARAVCATEKLLLLDEPITGLDPVVAEKMYEAVRALNRDKGITVLTVSHDIPAAVKYSDGILHIGNGVRFFGSSEEYEKSEIGIHFTGRCCEHV